MVTLFGDFQSVEDERVLDSFAAETHQGDVDYVNDLGINVAFWGLETVAINKTAKMIPDEYKERLKEKIYGEGHAIEVDNVYHAKSSPEITQSVLDGINPRYFNDDARFGKGFYVAEKGDTAIAEITYHGADASHVIRYQTDLSKAKVLDLSDPHIAEEWGYKRKSSNDYTDSKALSQKAQDQGFEVIRFPSERGQGNNLVVFESKLNEVLKPKGVSPAK